MRAALRGIKREYGCVIEMGRPRGGRVADGVVERLNVDGMENGGRIVQG